MSDVTAAVQELIEDTIANSDFVDRDEANDLALRAARQEIEDYDFSCEVESAIDNYDLTYIVQDCVKDMDIVQDILEEVESKIEDLVAQALRAAHNSVAKEKF